MTPLVHWHKLSINTAGKYSVQKSQLPKGKPIGYRQSAAKDFNPELSALTTQPLSEVLKVGDFYFLFGADRSTFSFVHYFIIETESNSIRANPQIKINFIFLHLCWRRRQVYC